MILFTFLDAQVQNKDSNCRIFIIIKSPHHTPSHTLTPSKTVNKSITWKKATYTFQFYKIFYCSIE